MSISAKCDFCGGPIVIVRSDDSTINVWQHTAQGMPRSLEACDRCNSKLTEMYGNVARKYFDAYKKLREDRL